MFAWHRKKSLIALEIASTKYKSLFLKICIIKDFQVLKRSRKSPIMTRSVSWGIFFRFRWTEFLKASTFVSVFFYRGSICTIFYNPEVENWRIRRPFFWGYQIWKKLSTPRNNIFFLCESEQIFVGRFTISHQSAVKPKDFKTFLVDFCTLKNKNQGCSTIKGDFCANHHRKWVWLFLTIWLVGWLSFMAYQPL